SQGLPDALLGGNDRMAIAALKLLAKRGVAVLRDILGTGFNGFEFRLYRGSDTDNGASGQTRRTRRHRDDPPTGLLAHSAEGAGALRPIEVGDSTARDVPARTAPLTVTLLRRPPSS